MNFNTPTLVLNPILLIIPEITSLGDMFIIGSGVYYK